MRARRAAVFLVAFFAVVRPARADFNAASAGTAADEFLELGGSARAAAMGEAFSAAADDATAAQYNPAALTRVAGDSLSLSHDIYLDSIYFENAALAHRLDADGVAAFSIFYVNYGAITETDANDNVIGTAHPSDLEVSGSYGWRIKNAGPWLDDGSLGLSVSYIDSTIVDSAQTVAATFGFLSRPFGSAGLRTSLVVQNLGGSQKFDQQANALPLTLRAGASLHPLTSVPDLLAAGDLVFPKDSAPYGALGGEYWIRMNEGPSSNVELDGLALRAGLNTQTWNSALGFSGVSMGVGFLVSTLQLDYAFVPFGSLGLTHRFTFSYRFGQGSGAAARSRAETVIVAQPALPGSEGTFIFQERMRQAQAAEAAKNMSKAAAEYRLAIAESPLAVPAHIGLARALMATSDWKGAKAELRTAGDLLPADDPQQVYIGERLGAVEVRMGELEQAQEYYQRAVNAGTRLGSKGSDLANAYLGLAFCAGQAGDYDAALADYKTAEKLVSDPQTKASIEKLIQALPQ